MTKLPRPTPMATGDEPGVGEGEKQIVPRVVEETKARGPIVALVESGGAIVSVPPNERELIVWP